MNEKPTHLDLFSEIGGFALAAGWAGFETVGFCDNEPYAQAVLKKHWPNVPIHGDIKALDGTAYRGVTLLTGGFPCQPFSNAGKRRGKDDDRYLWPQMLRIIQEAKPAWVVGENVVGIIGLALDQVCSDLEAEGYEVEPIIVPACAVDAPHRRDRCWILAHSKCDGQSPSKERGGIEEAVRLQQNRPHDAFNTTRASNLSSTEHDVADSVKQRREGRVHRREDAERQSVDGYSGCSGTTYGQSGEAIWLAEPSVGRVANGIPYGMDRIKGLGNAIVPQVAYQIIKGIRELL